MKNINDIAIKLGITEDEYSVYGKYKAKIDNGILEKLEFSKENGKVILVTAINPTPKGEGKTTTTIGLGDAINSLGKRTIICLREPSLGPVFGMKGGATGGGLAQVVPMEDINLHFTGDIHAVGTANNLLAAMIDNHIFQGNRLNIDVRRVVWRRTIDINDRQLRSIVTGIGSKVNGMPREDGFDLTVASEIMAVLCLSSSLEELKSNLSKMVVAYTYEGEPVTCKDLNAEGAIVVLLKDAFNPNLVQTLEHTPAFIHGGPFANIAHGCNSLIATKLAMKLSEFVITEAGFGADLGAEKFLDIKCRKGKIKPSAAVIVATIRALKYHGSGDDLEALKVGCENLKRHIKNLEEVYGLSPIVAINKFESDTEEEIKLLQSICKNIGVKFSLSTVFGEGSQGGLDLAKKVIEATEAVSDFKLAYDDNLSIIEKVETLSQKIYGAKRVSFSKDALTSIKKIESMGYSSLPICVAKTPFSFSDDPSLLGAPTGFEISVRDVKLSAGAGFIIIIAGNIMTMPGLPKNPSAENIGIDTSGAVVGL